ncbi:MAG TPA: PEP-CTERM sorting domain-containing protein, partial [Bryobacteraceae bacterium]|nr:PEP-CTERM sorting domain-containing protein [Bryobacteraceae bacterium]
ADEGFSDGYASLEILVDGLLDVRCSRGRCNAENLEVLDQPFTLGTEVAIAISGLTFVDSFYEGAGNSGLVYGYLGVQFREMPDPGDPATVPEPSTLALAIPLLGLISAARRRPRQRSA